MDRGRIGTSVALLALYVAQETAEGLLETGHPAGLAGVFGHGGLIAVPLALALGSLIAFAEWGARAVLRAPSGLDLARKLRRGAGRRPAKAALTWPAAPLGTAGELALHRAGRAPPDASW